MSWYCYYFKQAYLCRDNMGLYIQYTTNSSIRDHGFVTLWIKRCLGTWELVRAFLMIQINNIFSIMKACIVKIQLYTNTCTRKADPARHTTKSLKLICFSVFISIVVLVFIAGVKIQYLRPACDLPNVLIYLFLSNFIKLFGRWEDKQDWR